MNILSVINEEIHKFIKKEGVGDKYLEKKYNIPDEFNDFNKKYMGTKIDKNKVIVEKGDWKLIKNPESLENLDKSVRGVITKDGNLYVESYSEIIHNDILKILADKNIIPFVPKKDWGRKLPEESGFLTVQRYKDSPYMAIGESNRLLYDEDDYNKYIEHYKPLLNKARAKNPDINFVDKLVGVKYGDVSSKHLMKEWLEL